MPFLLGAGVQSSVSMTALSQSFSQVSLVCASATADNTVAQIKNISTEIIYRDDLEIDRVLTQGFSFASDGGFDVPSSDTMLNSYVHLIFKSGKINPYFSSVTSENVHQEGISPLK